METNFFKQIAQLGVTGNLHLIISKDTDNRLVVSTMLNNEQCGDKAKNAIIPLNLNGTAEELDEGYFERITTPLKAASGLMVNMEAFMKQLETAKKQSAMEKEKNDKEKKEKEAREKKFKEAMQKVEELEKEGKYRDAWVKVPEASEYPEHAEMLRTRRSSLAKKFAPDLFATTETENKTEDTEQEGSLFSDEGDKDEDFDESDDHYENEQE